MNELYGALMSWAIMLTGYAPPAQIPQVIMVPQSHLRHVACEGRACKVIGWFPPGTRIFLDDRLDPQNNLFASSVLVHEMVHYLQQQSGRYGARYSCEDAVTMEREAYAAQREFLVRYGVYQPVGASMHHVGCELAAHDQTSDH